MGWCYYAALLLSRERNKSPEKLDGTAKGGGFRFQRKKLFWAVRVVGAAELQA